MNTKSFLFQANDVDTPLQVETTETFRNSVKSAFREFVALAEKNSAESRVGGDRQSRLSRDRQIKILLNNSGIDVAVGNFIQWLNAPGDGIAEGLGPRTDRRILNAVKNNNAVFVELAKSQADVSTANRRRLRVCQVTLGDHRGTGVFLTETAVLTCWHVLQGMGWDARPTVVLPHHYGRTDHGINGWSRKIFPVRRSADGTGIRLLAQSQSYANSIEIGEWPAMNPPALQLDYCVIEIDPENETWDCRLNGAVGPLMRPDAIGLLMRLPNQLPNIRLPVAEYLAEELDNTAIRLVRIVDGSQIDREHIAAITLTASNLQRVRYRDAGLDLGDSGSALLNNAGQLVGIHNACIGLSGQAVPIGPVFADIRKQNRPLYNDIVES